MLKPFIYGRANWFPYRTKDNVRYYIVQITDLDGASAFVLGRDFNFEQAKGLCESINGAIDQYMKKEIEV